MMLTGTIVTTSIHLYAQLPAVTPLSVAIAPSPAGGFTDTPYTFSATFSDANGPSDIAKGVLYIMSNVVPGTPAWSGYQCVLRYDISTNQVTLISDQGTEWLSPIVAGGPGSLSNLQCQVSGSGSSAKISGNTVTVNFQVTFTRNFSGDKQLYLQAQDAAGNWTENWQQKFADWILLNSSVKCGSSAPAPDDVKLFPGLISSGSGSHPEGFATARLYRSPDGKYDKPVVIPMPFDPQEQGSGTTPECLYELFSPFVNRVRARGYDVWLVTTLSGQNIHEQAAEFAQAVNYAASISPDGKTMIAAYSLGGLTARVATARWEADEPWRQSLGLSSVLPVSLLIFGDAPLRGAQVSEGLQEGVWQLGHQQDFNLNSCGAQQLLRFSFSGLQDRPTIADTQRNWNAFYEEGGPIYFAPGGVADGQGTTPDGKAASFCNAGPAVFHINGDGWPHNPSTKIIAISDGTPGPMMCYGDRRDWDRSGDTVCPGFPAPVPRAPQIFDKMYEVNTLLGGPTPVLAFAEDLEGGSRFSEVLTKEVFVFGGVKQFFAGTFIPISSSLPSDGPFAATHFNSFQGLHAQGYPENINFIVDWMQQTSGGGGGGGDFTGGGGTGGGGGSGGCTQSPPAVKPGLIGPQGCFSGTRPMFEWWAVPNADNYKLAVTETTDPNNEMQLFYDVVAGTSTRLSFDLQPEKRYRWKVKGQNCGGPGPFSDIRYFTISSNCQPPVSAPVLIGPKGCIDQSRPVFTWSAVPGATSYRIVVSPADHDDFFIDQYVTGTSLSSPVALNPKIQYRFKVRAINDAGLGPWAESMYFTTFCGGVASMITSPLGCINTTTPTFAWQAVSPAIQYWLLVADSPDFSNPSTAWLVNQNLTGTSFSPGVAFSSGKTYYSKVKTILDPSSTTAAAWSATVSFTPFCPRPAGPAGLTATAGNAFVTLSWSASSGAIGYNVKRSTVSGGPYTILASGIAGSSYSDLTVSNGTTYYYAVSATTSQGESGNSQEVAALPMISPPAPLSWMNPVGVTINGNSLSKSDPNQGWLAGASSQQAIASGDGYVEFTVNETNTFRMLGLSSGDSDQTYSDIDFAFYPAADGNLYVYEGGVYKGGFGAYASGDRLRVGVESGVVRYRRNGVALYSSLGVPLYPLLVDTSLYSPGATLSNAVMQGNMTVADPGAPVSWSNGVGVTVNRNNLTKSDPNALWSAGASSVQSLASGDGYVELTASETNTYRMLGLSHGDTDQSYGDIDFALYLVSGGSLYVYEGGAYKAALGTYVTGDHLRVAVTSGVVKYYKNGTLLYSSTAAPVYPLLVDTSLYSPGATLTNALIAGNWR